MAGAWSNSEEREGERKGEEWPEGGGGGGGGGRGGGGGGENITNVKRSCYSGYFHFYNNYTSTRVSLSYEGQLTSELGGIDPPFHITKESAR